MEARKKVDKLERQLALGMTRHSHRRRIPSLMDIPIVYARDGLNKVIGFKVLENDIPEVTRLKTKMLYNYLKLEGYQPTIGCEETKTKGEACEIEQ